MIFGAEEIKETNNEFVTDFLKDVKVNASVKYISNIRDEGKKIVMKKNSM